MSNTDDQMMGAWATWTNPGEPHNLYAFFSGPLCAARVVRFSNDGRFEDVTGQWFPYGVPDYEPKLHIADSKVLQVEDEIYARVYTDGKDEVYVCRMSAPECSWDLIEVLPPGLVKLRGGGLALAELDD